MHEPREKLVKEGGTTFTFVTASKALCGKQKLPQATKM
jgi:hypothetical protein